MNSVIWILLGGVCLIVALCVVVAVVEEYLPPWTMKVIAIGSGGFILLSFLFHVGSGATLWNAAGKTFDAYLWGCVGVIVATFIFLAFGGAYAEPDTVARFRWRYSGHENGPGIFPVKLESGGYSFLRGSPERFPPVNPWEEPDRPFPPGFSFA